MNVMTHPKDKRILITGGSRGVGYAAAEALALRGFNVMVTSRTADRAQAAALRLRESTGNPQVQGIVLNLSSLHDTAAAADQISAVDSRLDVVIANAAFLSMSRTRQVTAEGLEASFGTNHLGHFLLITHLLPLLKLTANRFGEARVIVVSSRLHKPGSMGPPTDFRFDDLNLERGYRPMLAYKNSKLANVWFTYELNRRVSGTGVTANVVCPGFVPASGAESNTGVQRLLYRYLLPLLPFARTPEEAAETYAYAAVAPGLNSIGGKFFAEGRVIASSIESYDERKARQLWEISEALVSRAMSQVIVGKRFPG